MAIEIRKVDVWMGEIEDRPGGVSEKLRMLSEAGANFEFVLCRRTPEKPGKGVVFLAPLRGAAQTRAAKNTGLSQTGELHSLRLDAPDRAGLAVRLTQVIAEAGISLRGFSASVVGRRCVCFLAFDSNGDAKKASSVLKKAL